MDRLPDRRAIDEGAEDLVLAHVERNAASRCGCESGPVANAEGFMATSAIPAAVVDDR